MLSFTPTLAMTLARGVFRFGRGFFDEMDVRARSEPVRIAQVPIGAVNDDVFLIDWLWDSGEPVRAQFGTLFDLAGPAKALRADLTQVDLTRELERARAMFSAAHAKGLALPDWVKAANVSGGDFVVIASLLTPDMKKRRWTRHALMLADIGLEAVAAQPQILGLNARTEELIGAFASKVDSFLGENIEQREDIDFVGLKDRAAATLFRASLATIIDHPGMVVKKEHWQDFATAVLKPIEAAQAANADHILAVDSIQALMRGPVAHAALGAIQRNKTAFLGQRFAADKAAGVVTESILAAAIEVGASDFNITRAFGEKGVALIYRATLSAAEKNPELFVNADGQSVESLRNLFSGLAGVLKDAPPPFGIEHGIADKLAAVVVDVAASHLTKAVLNDVAGEGPWKLAEGQILKSIIEGFRDGLRSDLADADRRFSAFDRLFTADQAVGVVKIIAAQAAKTPQMLLGDNHRNEVYAITKGIAAFMADPNTRLASPEDWRLVIATAMEEAARNPGTLFFTDAEAAADQHLAVTLIGMVLKHAAEGMRLPSGQMQRRRGALLFGETLGEAIRMTLRTAANNITPLLDANSPHRAALDRFLGKLQSYVASQNGRVGAREWLHLYRYFLANVIEQGPALEITDALLERALAGLPTTTAAIVAPAPLSDGADDFEVSPPSRDDGGEPLPDDGADAGSNETTQEDHP